MIFLKSKKQKIVLSFVFYMLGMNAAISGIMINNTRIIYDQKYKSANITLTNVTPGNYAVQVWVNGESDKKDEKTSFIATPPIFRLDPGQEQVVKVLKLPGDLPENRESIFYFNAQEIPATNKKENSNKLVMAIRTRVKLLYRPSGLSMTVNQASEKLQWKLVKRSGGDLLQVVNASPYYITPAEITVNFKSKKINIHEPEMLAPFSTKEFRLKDLMKSNDITVDYSVINDYGGITHFKKINVALETRD